MVVVRGADAMTRTVRDRASRLGYLLAALAAALIAAPAPAQPVPSPTAEETAKLTAIGVRGRLLFDLDRAAWVATDDLLRTVRDPAAAGVQGYVVESDGAGFAVTFFGGAAGRQAGIYVARVADGRVVSSRLLPAAERIVLTPAQIRLAAARSAATRTIQERPCTGRPFNAAIVPPSAPEAPVEVYLTSPQTETGVYPFGGHFLVTVGADGRVLSQRKFTNSCMNMALPRASRRRGTPAAAVITHLLDPTPTEIHVFLSLSMAKPVYVMTGEPRRIWAVDGAAIALAETADK